MSTTASLLGARIRRVDAPSPDLWAITLATAEARGTLIVSLQPGATGIGWSEKRPHGLPATSFVQKLRKELEGGRLQALDEVGSRLELAIAKAQQTLRLCFDFGSQNVVLYAGEEVVASAHKERGGAGGRARAKPTETRVPLAPEADARGQVSFSQLEGRGGDRGRARAEPTESRAPLALEADARGQASLSELEEDGGDRSRARAEPVESRVPVAPEADAHGQASLGELEARGGDRGRARAESAESRVALVLELSELEERARSLLADRSGALLALRKTALIRGLRATRKKLARKQAAIAGDAARAEDAPALRQRAQLLLSNLHAIKRGATAVSLIDYTLDPPAEVEVTLDPAQNPRELAEAWFKRARRFERGAVVAMQRAAAGAAELAVLDALEAEIDASADTDTLDELAVRAERLGVRSELPSQVAAVKAKEPSRHVPYRTLIGAGDRPILVGKGASDNDVLTREHARPHDLWLHARDVAGAHVVVPLEKNEVCPQELLLDAAHAAAHYSEAKGEATVDVSYTPRRYVRKPKGSPVGLVVLEREKVLRLVVEAGRIARLLATDRA